MMNRPGTAVRSAAGASWPQPVPQSRHHASRHRMGQPREPRSCPQHPPFTAAAMRPDVDWVNPLTGALTTSPDTACGKTFPGAVMPFGLVQLSPDTVSGGTTAAAIQRT